MSGWIGDIGLMSGWNMYDTSSEGKINNTIEILYVHIAVFLLVEFIDK